MDRPAHEPTEEIEVTVTPEMIAAGDEELALSDFYGQRIHAGAGLKGRVCAVDGVARRGLTHIALAQSDRPLSDLSGRRNTSLEVISAVSARGGF